MRLGSWHTVTVRSPHYSMILRSMSPSGPHQYEGPRIQRENSLRPSAGGWRGTTASNWFQSAPLRTAEPPGVQTPNPPEMAELHPTMHGSQVKEPGWVSHRRHRIGTWTQPVIHPFLQQLLNKMFIKQLLCSSC